MNRRTFFQSLFATFAAWKWTMAEVPELPEAEPEYRLAYSSLVCKECALFQQVDDSKGYCLKVRWTLYTQPNDKCLWDSGVVLERVA